jgi:hypothetical protein
MTKKPNPNKLYGSSGTARFSPSLQNAILNAQNEKKVSSFAKNLETSNSLYIAYPPSNS